MQVLTRDIFGHEGVSRVVKLGSAVDSSIINISDEWGSVGSTVSARNVSVACLQAARRGVWRNRARAFGETALSRTMRLFHRGMLVMFLKVCLIIWWCPSSGSVTPYKAIKVNEVVPGRWMLISSAGGGVGALGLQYAKSMRYRVIAVNMGDNVSS